MIICEPNTLKLHLKSLAVLDAIIMQRWDLRYYSYSRLWHPPNEMASMRSGSGDHYFILFLPTACIVKAFCRGTKNVEAAPPPESLYREIPSTFGTPFLREPAFLLSEVSFVLWKIDGEPEWNVRPFGALENETHFNLLFEKLTCGPDAFRNWAQSYYEREIPLEAVQAIYEHHQISDQIISELNQNVDKSQLSADLDEIGYPSRI